MTEIGHAAFRQSGLVNAVLPDGCHTIGDYAFYGSSLEEVRLPARLISIGNCAFSFTKLQNIDFPQSLEEIGSDAFTGTLLKEAVLPEGVKRLGQTVFSACELTFLSIPPTVEQIALNAFGGIPEHLFTVYEGGYYIGNADNPYYALLGFTDPNAASYIIHPDTVVLEDEIFAFHKNLTHIEIPDRVIAIPKKAFYQSGIQTMVIGQSVKRIGKSAFEQCQSLTEIRVPKQVSELGEDAFARCLFLKTAILEEGVTTAATGTFCGCDFLETITLPATLVELPKLFLASTSHLREIHYQGTKAEWQALAKAFNWNQGAAASGLGLTYWNGDYIVRCVDGDLNVSKSTSSET